MVVAGKYVRIILSPNLIAVSCICIFYEGLDAWPINTEIPRMTLLAICRVGNVPEHGISLQDFVDIWHPALGLRCRKPPRHLSKLKARTIPLI